MAPKIQLESLQFIILNQKINVLFYIQKLTQRFPTDVINELWSSNFFPEQVTFVAIWKFHSFLKQRVRGKWKLKHLNTTTKGGSKVNGIDERNGMEHFRGINLQSKKWCGTQNNYPIYIIWKDVILLRVEVDTWKGPY